MTTISVEEKFLNEALQYQKGITNSCADLKHMMNTALKDLELLKVPTKKNDNWKYLTLSSEIKGSSILLSSDSKLGDAPLNKLPSNSPKFVFVNGKLSVSLSTNIDKIQYIHINPLNDAHYIHEGVLSFKHDKESFFDTLNLASLKEGLHIILKENSVYRDPICIIHLFSDESINHCISNRVLIHAKKGSQASFYESYYYQGLTQVQHFTNGVTELLVEENSNIEYILSQADSQNATHLSNIKSSVYKDSTLNILTQMTGAKKSKNMIHVDLVEEGAHCTVNGIYVLKDEQESDQFIKVNHKKANTTSSQLFKGVLDDKSKGSFTGNVCVHRDAQLVSSEQLNNNLLLSKKAHINTRPQLEVYADDVKCSHGSTTGQLDDEQLFYLQTRGIQHEVALQMLCNAFTQDVVQMVTNDKIRSLLIEKLQ